ncbi:MAG TPA: helix-turn-helix domain-containing protein [Mycobacteriales bacterium]|nr:helix-turn-helix domain-containing protein [Mycobacteriales bacterium]
MTATTTRRPYRGASLEDRRRDQRERIIAAARSVFARDGFAASSIDDIVSGARVSRTSFYELFTSKERCLLAVYQEGIDRVATAVARAVARDLEPVDRIRAEVSAVAATFGRDPEMARVVLIEAVGAGAEVEQARVAARRAMAKVIEDQLAGYPEWAARTAGERRTVSMSAMASIVEPLSYLVAAGRLSDWERQVEPITRFVAGGLIPRGEAGRQAARGRRRR